MLTTTTHTYLQGDPYTQLVVYLFIITMCDYGAQIMELGDRYSIYIQEVYYAPTSYLYPPVPGWPQSAKNIYNRYNRYIKDLWVATRVFWGMSGPPASYSP